MKGNKKKLPNFFAVNMGTIKLSLSLSLQTKAHSFLLSRVFLVIIKINSHKIRLYFESDCYNETDAVGWKIQIKMMHMCTDK